MQNARIWAPQRYPTCKSPFRATSGKLLLTTSFSSLDKHHDVPGTLLTVTDSKPTQLSSASRSGRQFRPSSRIGAKYSSDARERVMCRSGHADALLSMPGRHAHDSSASAHPSSEIARSNEVRCVQAERANSRVSHTVWAPGERVSKEA